MTNSLDLIESLAIRLADTSRDITLGYFRQPLSIEDKPDKSPVTIADKETESKLRQMILQEFPDHGIYGEEFGVENLDADSIWILDPIDGTGSFVYGVPLYGTLISVVENGRSTLGLIDMPALDERWIGKYDHPTLYNGVACQTSDCKELNAARMLCTTPDMFNANETIQFNKLSNQVRMSRFGGDCYCYGLLASGNIDLVVESDLKPYDFMAHLPVIQGAGGVISDWHGKPLTIDSGPQVIAAATPELHQLALEILTS